jgi:hypothetical protein
VDESSYREMPPDPPDPYLAVWAELQRRQTITWIFRLAWLGLGMPLLVLAVPLHHAVLGGCILVPFFLVCSCGTLYYGRSPACPRCGKSIHRSGWIPGIRYAKRCERCDLRIGSTKHDALAGRD